MQVDKPNAKPSAATVPTVTMETCAIFIMVLGVSVNLAQEKLIKIASIQDTTTTLEPMNAKVFVSSNKVSLSCKISLSNNIDTSCALFTSMLEIVNNLCLISKVFFS